MVNYLFIYLFRNNEEHDKTQLVSEETVLAAHWGLGKGSVSVEWAAQRGPGSGQACL